MAAGQTDYVDLEDLNVRHLKDYLRERGAHVSGTKSQLLKRARELDELGYRPLSEIQTEDEKVDRERQLARFTTSIGEKIPEPWTVMKWISDTSNIPIIRHTDLINYFVYSRKRTFDTNSMKAKRQLKAKVFYEDRHVHKIQYSPIYEDCSHCYIKSKVIPSLPGSASENKKPDYDTWVCVNKETGNVHSAGCTCSAGMSEKKYRKYDVSKVGEAAEKVRTRTLSLRKAAELYGIPRSTISDHVVGKVKDGAKAGAKTVFDKDTETQFAGKLKVAAEEGFGLTRGQVMTKASQLGAKLNLKTPFRHGTAGKNWYYGFMRRHPDLSLRKPQKLSTSRSSAMIKEDVQSYYTSLGSILNNEALIHAPQKVWNMDESGFHLEHTPVNVVAGKGARSVPSRVSMARDNVTVVACVNANGFKMPPMFIVKGKTPRSLLSFNTGDGPQGAIWAFQEKAWVDDELGALWFRNVFLKHCGPERPQLLIVDQHHSHEVLETLYLAKQENIIILAMPAHSSHWLQPLDKGCFGPLTKRFNTICTEYMSVNVQNVVTKASFAGLFARAWCDAMTEHNIKKGFQVTGIFPYDPSAIPSRAYRPCLTNDVTEHARMTTDDQRPTTSITDDQRPTKSITDDQRPTTSVTNKQHPTASVTDEQRLTTSVTDEQRPTTSVTDEQHPTASVTDEQRLTTSVTDEQRLTTSNSDDLSTDNLMTHDPILTTLMTDDPCQTTDHSRLPKGSTGVSASSSEVSLSDLSLASSSAMFATSGNVTLNEGVVTSTEMQPVITDPSVVEALLKSLSGTDVKIVDINTSVTVDELFSVCNTNQAKLRKQSTPRGHRLLTSDECITNKVIEKEKKDMREKAKQDRFEKRQRKTLTKDKSTEKRGKGQGKGKGKQNVRSAPLWDTSSQCLLCLSSNTDIPWIKCDSCECWLHQSCVPNSFQQRMIEAIETNDDFICHICILKSRES